MRKNAERRWVELLAVSLVRALNHSKVPRSVTIVYANMWLTAGRPWTVSALANASSLDRASVRDCLAKMPDDHFVRGPDGIMLTDKGHQHAVRAVVAYYRAISVDVRRPLRIFFSAKYAGREPLRQVFSFFMEIDYATRRFPHSLAFRTSLACIEMMAPRGTVWSIRDVAAETGYSYQACHKALAEIEAAGLAQSTDAGYVVTRRGRLRSVIYFMSAIRRARPRMLRLLFEILTFHNPPP